MTDEQPPPLDEPEVGAPEEDEPEVGAPEADDKAVGAAGAPYQAEELGPAYRAAGGRHRGVLWAGVTVAILFVGGLLFAVLTSRGNADAVPGSDPVASLAVIRGGYLVGTTGGLAVSPDGRSWSIAHLPAEVVAVSAEDGTTAYVLAGGQLHATTDLSTYSDLASGVAGTVIAAGPTQTVDVGAGDHIVRIVGSGSVDALPAGRSEPAGLRGLAVSPSDPNTILAGSPLSGLWETTDGAVSWHRLLPTPIQAVLIDASDAQQVFIGTQGGVLHSGDGGRTWSFTGLRLDTQGLAQEGGRIYAIASDRVIYSSADGVAGWSPVVSG